MKYFLIVYILVFTGAITSAIAQERVKPTYRQFFFNPYLYNPAFAGINNQSELNIVYKKQWVNIDGAPVTTGLNLQIPTSTRVVLGLNIVTDKQVLLRNTSVLGTFGYVVPIDHKQSLRFALSGGFGTNKLDLTHEELNTNDPAILSAASNNYYIDGNFGVVYTYEGLRLGFALTELFKSDPFNQEAFNEFSISNLKNRTYSVSYRFNLDRFQRVAMEPYVVYKQSEREYQSAWEAATVLYFKDKLWTGVSYHQYGGLGILLGLNVADKLRFSYNYEFPSFKSDFPAMSTHELQLSLKFGKKRITSVKQAPKKKRKFASNTAPATNHINYENGHQETGSDLPVSTASNTDNFPPANPSPEESSAEKSLSETSAKPQLEEPIEEVAAKKPATDSTRLSTPLIFAKGHYVVVGTYRYLQNALEISRQLSRKGYASQIALNLENNFYHVYIHSTNDLEDARRIRNQYRLKSLFKDAWVFTKE